MQAGAGREGEGEWKKENNNKKTRTKEEKRGRKEEERPSHTAMVWKQDVDGRIGLATLARARTRS